METRKVLKVSKKSADAADESGLRERIVGTAGTLFLRSGFVRVTMDEIAAALGISKATLYRHFSGKQELLAAFVRATAAEIMAGVEAIVGDPACGVPDKLISLFGYLAARFAGFGPVLIRDIRRSAPRLWEELERFRREKVNENFRALMAQGVAEGVFRADVDLDLMIGMYATLIQEYLNPETVLRLDRAPVEIFRTIVVVFFQGILTERGRARFPDWDPAAPIPKKSRPS